MPRASNNKTWTESYYGQLAQAIRMFLPQRGLPLTSHKKNVRWSKRLLAICAILTHWASGERLGERFRQARECIAQMYDSRRRPGTNLQGFVNALANKSDDMLKVLQPALRKATRQVAKEHWRYKHWAVMTVDGSRFECPRTAANEEAFECAGKDKTTPQQFVTMVLHTWTNLPWDWRRGPGKSAERHQLREMIPSLPPKTLLLGDAGFTGYDLFAGLLAQGHDFLVRVGGNVNLLQNLGYYEKENGKTVYLWPQEQRNKKKPPIVLRLEVIRGKGKPAYVVTNVLDESILSGAEIKALYKLRWGVEVGYRSLKQTMKRAKLVSDSPENAKAELDWVLVGFWLLGLMTVKESTKVNEWSFAMALVQVRENMMLGRERCGREQLRKGLRLCKQDNYKRRGSKDARDYPRKNTRRPPKPPNLRVATETEVLHVKGLMTKDWAA